MYRLDTDSFPNKWVFSHSWRRAAVTDSQLATLLDISERTARRWRTEPAKRPRAMIDHAAAVLLGHILPDRWQARGLHFDNTADRLVFEESGEGFALGCLAQCDYLARLKNWPEPTGCQARRHRRPCAAPAPVQAPLFAPDGQPASTPPLH